MLSLKQEEKQMATSKEFKVYVCERLGGLGGITCRPMMGEFLLYHNGLLFGGIYDGKVLVKRTETKTSSLSYQKKFHIKAQSQCIFWKIWKTPTSSNPSSLPPAKD